MTTFVFLFLVFHVFLLNFIIISICLNKSRFWCSVFGDGCFFIHTFPFLFFTSKCDRGRFVFNVDFHIVRIKGKSRFDVGIHLLSTQICCKSDKKKKVSNYSCALLYCAVRCAVLHPPQLFISFAIER